MKKIPQCSQKTEKIRLVGTSVTGLSESESHQMMPHAATSIAERHGETKMKRTSVGKKTTDSLFQRNWSTDESVILTGEICYLDIDRLIPIIEPKKDPCSRSKSYPTDQSGNRRRNRRLLPRRPRIDEEQPKVQPPNEKPIRPGARLKKIMEKSFSVKPALMSVARRRYLEYQGLSTCQPHELPPLAQRKPVAASTSSSNNGSVSQNGQREKLISISDLPKSSDCKDIFLRANLGPLRERASHAEKRELIFQHWKRQFHAKTKKALYEKEETSTSPKHHRGNNFKSCIPGEVDRHRASCETSFQVDKTQQAGQNTEALPVASEKDPFTSVSPTRQRVVELFHRRGTNCGLS